MSIICPYCDLELIYRQKHKHLVFSQMNTEIAALCPRCHSENVEIEIIKGSHLYGEFQWSIIIDCKNCKLSFSIPDSGNEIEKIIKNAIKEWSKIK